MASETIRDWEMWKVQKYCHLIGKRVAIMAQQGDGMALAVFNAYHECYRSQAPDGSPANLSLRDALHDFFQRDVLIKEREALAHHHGLQLPKSIN